MSVSNIEDYMDMLAKDGVAVFREGETKLDVGLMLTRISYLNDGEKYNRQEAFNVLADRFGFRGRKVEKSVLLEWLEWWDSHDDDWQPPTVIRVPGADPAPAESHVMTIDEYITILAQDAVAAFREGETEMDVGLLLTRIAQKHEGDKYDRGQVRAVFKDRFGSDGKRVQKEPLEEWLQHRPCLLYTSPSPRDS